MLDRDDRKYGCLKERSDDHLSFTQEKCFIGGNRVERTDWCYAEQQ